ncbi:MAG: PadR family transcriptional regulator [Candidatus Bathyarchaeia archaeon]
MEKESTEIMKEQLKKGYLKLAILYTLLRGPLHGYEMIKRIKESTFNLLTPTAGSLYPALKELESDGFITGRWVQQRRRVKVYMITEKGKEAFKEVIDKHFRLASAIRGWLLTRLAPIHPIEGEEPTAPALMQQAVKIILLGDNVRVEERIEFLKEFRRVLQRVNETINRLIVSIDKRIMDLEAEINPK